jgi:hypothetical protein
VQQIGRGTRLYRGKVNTLVLDFVGNFNRLGPFDAPVIGNARGSGSAPLVKQCIECSSIIGIASRTCPHCDAVLIAEERAPRELRTAPTADRDAVMLAADAVPLRVASMRASLHRKAGSADSLKLRFTTDCGRVVDEWLVCWHSSEWPAKKARSKWALRWPHTGVPSSAALAVELINANPSRFKPKLIRVTRASASDLPSVVFVNAGERAA